MKRLLLLMVIAGMMLLSGCGKEAKWGKDFENPDPEVRKKAAYELGEMATSEAITQLTIHEDDKDPEVREAVKKALAKIGKRTFLK